MLTIDEIELAFGERMEKLIAHLRAYIQHRKMTPAQFFTMLDANNDNNVELDEFVQGVSETRLPADMGVADVKALFAYWDKDHDGMLTIDEIELAFTKNVGR